MYLVDMDGRARSVDQAALAGVGVAGGISISSAEGLYTPFDSILGIVLILLYGAFRLPGKVQRRNDARFLAAQSGVLALLGCMILGPAVEVWALRAEFLLPLKPLNEDGFPVDTLLAGLWLILFSVAWASSRLFTKPGDVPAAPTADTAEPDDTAEPKRRSNKQRRVVPVTGELWEAAKAGGSIRRKGRGLHRS
jgi:hypothetical protein